MNQTLFRPVGLFELRLIQTTDYRAFPPRLPAQPFFYPVLNEAYAAQIAREWNTKDVHSGYMGAVTAFDVTADYLARFESHTVGSAVHQELWIPSEHMDEFNQHLIGTIRVTATFYGEQYSGTREW